LQFWRVERITGGAKLEAYYAHVPAFIAVSDSRVAEVTLRRALIFLQVIFLKCAACQFCMELSHVRAMGRTREKQRIMRKFHSHLMPWFALDEVVVCVPEKVRLMMIKFS
jgi:hypothetical protein